MENPCKACHRVKCGKRCSMDGVKRCRVWDEWFTRAWNEIKSRMLVDVTASPRQREKA